MKQANSVPVLLTSRPVRGVAARDISVSRVVCATLHLPYSKWAKS